MFSHHLTHLKPFAAGPFKHIGLDVGVKMYYSLIRTLAMRKYKKCENIAKVLSLLIKFYRKCLSL
jgi:hypothetical protein